MRGGVAGSHTRLMTTTTTPLPAAVAEIARVFAFDGDDLAANRQLRLSEHQRAAFAHSARLARRRPRRIALLVVLAVAASLAMLAMQGAPPAQLGVAGAAAGAVGLVIVLVARLNRRSARAMETATVKTAVGVPELSPSMTQGRWWLTVQGVRFSVDVADTRLFRDGMTYRIYYAEVWPGPAILSVDV